jgi:hypothetical protein
MKCYLGYEPFDMKEQRSGVLQVKIRRRPYKPEKYPTSNHNENGSISKLVEPKQHNLLSKVKFSNLF